MFLKKSKKKNFSPKEYVNKYDNITNSNTKYQKKSNEKEIYDKYSEKMNFFNKKTQELTKSLEKLKDDSKFRNIAENLKRK